MSFVEKLAAIRRTCGLSEEEVALPLALAAALGMMGIVSEPSWTAVTTVNVLAEAMGLKFGEPSAAGASASSRRRTRTSASR